MELLALILSLLFVVVRAGLRGELDGDAEGEASAQPDLSVKIGAVDFADCGLCGKPNAATSDSCSACGAHLRVARI